MNRLIATVVCLIGAVPALAQDKSEANAKEQVGKLLALYKEAWVKEDAAALSNLFATNGIVVGVTGQEVVGRAAIEQNARDLFKRAGDVVGYEETVDHAKALGDGYWAIGHIAIKGSTGMVIDGHWAKVYIREDRNFKIAVLDVGINVKPAQAKQ